MDKIQQIFYSIKITKKEDKSKNSNILFGRYPFDVQQCQLTLSMRRAFDPFTHLVAQQMRYISNKLTKMFYHPTSLQDFFLGLFFCIGYTVRKRVTQKLESSAINFLFRPLYIFQSFPKVLGTKVNDKVRCDLNQN